MRIFGSRSTPALAARSSSSGSPDRVRADRKATGIILFRRGERAFFAYGFSKSQRANIDVDEEQQFKEAARHVLALREKQLAELLRKGDFVEVKGPEVESE
ncbi:MAG: type II toxin-antitoxin system RelE/ParE family toxin [Bryobacteraceae bacterium]